MSTAYNNTPPDNSYGLWQINLYPGAQSLAALGLSNPNQLFDPATNAAAAFAIWNGSSSNFAIAWGSSQPNSYQPHSRPLTITAGTAGMCWRPMAREILERPAGF